MQTHYARTVALALSMVPLTAYPSLSQIQDEIRVDIRQDTARQQMFLNGYRSTIGGQIISYHSSHPDANAALLVRARKEAHSISWETDATPKSYADDQYRFIWLAGLECAGFQNPAEVHSFNVLVNGEHWFTFTNRKDSLAKTWKVVAPNGAELAFECTLVDRAGDLFGFMRLTVPKQLVPGGKPLAIQVVGEDEESGDWYMTFQYSFSFEPRVREEPVLLRSQYGESQVLRLSLDNLVKGRSVRIVVSDRQVASRTLDIGSNVFIVPVGAVNASREIPVSLTVDGQPVSRRFVALQPIKRRDVYLLSYSHNDIGYTDLQPNIEKKQWRNLEEALRIIKLTKDYPPEARYKWNMEVLWSLDSYLRQAPASKRQEVIDAIREGSIGLNALYANELTGLANAVEMSHFTDFARTFDTTYSIPITTALVSDVPGFTWGIVPTLAHSGVKYFSIAPNAGDRTGYTLEEWGDKPFYWKSQSGDEKVLTWVAGASYSSFHEGDLSKLGDEKLFTLLRRLDETKYPYGIVQLPYTIGGDNGPPDPNLSDFVKGWNERYATPRLIIATHEQMFKEFERRYGAKLPEYSGDFTPYWEDGAASSASETAINRQAADRLTQDEALWAMIAPQSFPESRFAAAWRDVILYDEHTWGAYNSVSDPDLPFVKGQWAIKQRFALDADSLSRLLQANLFPERPGRRTAERGFDVYNTGSWPRTDVVFLSAEQSAVGDLVDDMAGRRVPSQRLSTGELAVLIKDIPPMSGKRFFVRKGKAPAGGSVSVSGNELQNGLISLTVSKTSGAIDTLLWKRNGLQLVDLSRGAGLSEYVYVPGKNPEDAKRLSNASVRVKEQGPLIASLLVEADAPGCRGYSEEIRLIDGIDRVDIIDRIDKEAIREKEGVHIAFPFLVPDGLLRYDVASGIVRPSRDQLPGACKNFFSVQSWVDVSNDQRGVTWTTADAPLIEIGAITAEKPWMKEIQPAQNFYSYVMNNYWHTNYRADQDGPVAFRYSLRPHGEYIQEEAVKLGMDQRQPLIVAPARDSLEPPQSLFKLATSSVVALSTKAISGAESWLIYLYNTERRPQSTRIEWNESIPVSIFSSDSFGRMGREISRDFELAGYGSMYIRVNRR